MPAMQPDANLTHRVRISVPSGRLAVGNDFRQILGDPWTTEDRSTYRSINDAAGKASWMEAFASQLNTGIGFVGNVSPSVYAINQADRPDTLVIGYAPDDASLAEWLDLPEDEDVTKDMRAALPTMPPSLELTTDPRSWVEVASICTDLWWFMVVDAEIFEAAGGEIGNEFARPYEVRVTPGVYEIVCYTDAFDFDQSGVTVAEVYAEINRVADIERV